MSKLAEEPGLADPATAVKRECVALSTGPPILEAAEVGLPIEKAVVGREDERVHFRFQVIILQNLNRSLPPPLSAPAG